MGYGGVHVLNKILFYRSTVGYRRGLVHGIARWVRLYRVYIRPCFWIESRTPRGWSLSNLSALLLQHASFPSNIKHQTHILKAPDSPVGESRTRLLRSQSRRW